MKKIFITLGMLSALCACALMGCGDADDGKISDTTNPATTSGAYSTTVPNTGNTGNKLESDITQLSSELANGATELSSRLANGATDLSKAMS